MLNVANRSNLNGSLILNISRLVSGNYYTNLLQNNSSRDKIEGYTKTIKPSEIVNYIRDTLNGEYGARIVLIDGIHFEDEKKDEHSNELAEELKRLGLVEGTFDPTHRKRRK